MNKDLKHIEYDGYIYWFEHKLARNRIDLCLATKDPQTYCNGYFLYSDKDPGSGMEFVIVKTNNPALNYVNI